MWTELLMFLWPVAITGNPGGQDVLLLWPKGETQRVTTVLLSVLDKLCSTIPYSEKVSIQQTQPMTSYDVYDAVVASLV